LLRLPQFILSDSRDGEEVPMLRELNVDQARWVAVLAKAARQDRDALLGNVAEDDLSRTTPMRGERNPTAALGFDPLPPDALTVMALREAIGSLSPAARSELYALMRLGQGHLAPRNWRRGLAEAVAAGDQTIAAAVMDDPDLHDHILKGLYELKLTA
jgi:hypothetical protein